MAETDKPTTTTGETPSPSNTSMTDSSTGGEGGEKKKGSSSSRLLKIRGFLTGKSRRQAKKSGTTTRGGAAAGGGNDAASRKSDDDQSTVYGVDVDDHDPASLAAKKHLLKKGDDNESNEDADFFNEHDAASRNYLLKIVLLLMDTKSRRFELLQLEFDSIKASVADVLSQIPLAVTEECLQHLTFNAITFANGQEKNKSDVLADFCHGGDVMVAVPSSSTAAECAKLALPILSDSKVVAMLKASGIDASPWKEAKKVAKREKSQTKTMTDVPTPSGMYSEKRAPEAAPKKPAKKSILGQKKTAPPTYTASASKESTKSIDPDEPVITFHPNDAPDLHSGPHTSRGVVITRSAVRPSAKKRLAMSVLIWVVLLAFIAALIKGLDMYLSAPIKAGQVLAPGTIRHKCGVAGLVPGLQPILSKISPRLDCENTHLVVGEENVTGYDKDGNVVWVILGTHHTDKKVCDVSNNTDCMRGLHYTEDKHLVVSGTRITWVETFGKQKLHLHPWPFGEKPVARTWRKK